MNVGIVAENYFPTVGGIQEHVRHLVEFLKGRGHRATVITGLPGVDKWQGPPDNGAVFRAGRAIQYGAMGTYTSMTIGPGVYRNLRALFAREAFDVLHVHGPFDVGLPTMALAQYRGPVVATLHSSFEHGPARNLMIPYYRWVARRVDRFMSVSPAAGRPMQRYVRFPYSVVPNGIDAAGFRDGSAPKKYGDGRVNILYMGRLEPRNGIDELIDSMPDIARRHPDVRFIVAGSGPKGVGQYRSRVRPEVGDRVEFLGNVFEERRDLLSAARVIVVPAKRASFSMVILEGLAAGVPVVATPCTEIDDRCSHWKTVRVCDGFTPGDIADAVCAELDEDPSDRIAEGLDVVREYDWGLVGDRILEEYRRTIGGVAG